MNNEATASAAGDRVEWQGFIEPNGNVMAQALTFDGQRNGKFD